jgi:phosphatidylserine decarboxylase
MSIAREGYPLILSAGVAAMVALALSWTAIGIVLGAVTLALAAFFRDPNRIVPSAVNLVIAPADGKVVSIAPAENPRLFEDAATRVSIFLSPLDVHINRAPVAGEISAVNYQRGSFMAAYKAQASERNEQNAVKITNGAGQSIGVVQIAGVLARRIVCRVHQGDRLARGERFGLIMFGSRTDTYLPKECSVEVVEGQRVKGGETILGRFR